MRRRYAAKLLFQFRYSNEDSSYSMRTVEERIILIESKSAKSALSEARRLGKSEQFSNHESPEASYHFEFIGIMDLLHLGIETDANQVWYDIRRMKNPMERKDDILPNESELNAIREEAAPVRTKNIKKTSR